MRSRDVQFPDRVPLTVEAAIDLSLGLWDAETAVVEALNNSNAIDAAALAAGIVAPRSALPGQDPASSIAATFGTLIALREIARVLVARGLVDRDALIEDLDRRACRWLAVGLPHQANAIQILQDSVGYAKYRQTRAAYPAVTDQNITGLLH